MIIRDFHHGRSNTRSYLVAHPRSRVAAIIDPVLEQVPEYSDVITRLGMRLAYTVETHLHDDHVTGAFQLRARFGSAAVFPAGLGAIGVDRQVQEGDVLALGPAALRVLSTPGQTACAISLYLSTPRQSAVFTGDLTHAAGVPLPDEPCLYRTLLTTIRERIYTLPESTLIHPGHDLAGTLFTTVGQERRFNPFAGGTRSFETFLEVMGAASTRPHYTLEGAARQNLIGGALSSTPSVGHSRVAHRLQAVTGPMEVSAAWLAHRLQDVRVVDFRPEAEFVQGHVVGSIRGGASLCDDARPWSRDTTLVCLGATADHLRVLEQLGFDRLLRLSSATETLRAAGVPMTGGGTKTTQRREIALA